MCSPTPLKDNNMTDTYLANRIRVQPSGEIFFLKLRNDEGDILELSPVPAEQLKWNPARKLWKFVSNQGFEYFIEKDNIVLLNIKKCNVVVVDIEEWDKVAL